MGAAASTSPKNSGSGFKGKCHWCQHEGHKESECIKKAKGAPKAKAKAKAAGNAARAKEEEAGATKMLKEVLGTLVSAVKGGGKGKTGGKGKDGAGDGHH